MFSKMLSSTMDSVIFLYLGKALLGHSTTWVWNVQVNVHGPVHQSKSTRKNGYLQKDNSGEIFFIARFLFVHFVRNVNEFIRFVLTEILSVTQP
jgi:hypothetical protein